MGIGKWGRANSDRREQKGKKKKEHQHANKVMRTQDAASGCRNSQPANQRPSPHPPGRAMNILEIVQAIKSAEIVHARQCERERGGREEKKRNKRTPWPVIA